jgi:adenylyl-sulfate kinase
MVEESRLAALLEEAAHLPSIQLAPEQLSHLELLARGLLDSNIFPLRLEAVPAGRVALRDGQNRRLAILAGDRSLEILNLPRSPGFDALRQLPKPRAGTAAFWVEGGIDSDVVSQLRTAGALLLLLARPWNQGPDVEDFALVRDAKTAADQLGAQLYLVPGPVRQEWKPYIAAALGAARSLPSIPGTFHPSKDRRGFCVWFTGLPSSGKSTIAEEFAILLAERGRPVTMLDGDVVRMHLSKGLGFTREDRDTNILRIAFVASEIVRHGGAVICAAVSPYESTRQQAASMIGQDRCIVVYVATPAEICEQRDVKGFYARARAGSMAGMTGVDDPYEPPPVPDLILTTTDSSPGQNAGRILQLTAQRGFL